MNPFASDKAPYAVALLISAVGWLLGSLHGNVQDSAIAAYRVQHLDNRAVVTITNLSKKNAIGPVRFKVSCSDGSSCFANPNDAVDVGFGSGGLIDLPPELAILGEGSTTRSAYIHAVLPPGSSISIDAGLKRPRAPVSFQFVPDAEKPEALYIVEATSFFAFFIAHYYLLMVVISGLLVSLFGGWLVAQALRIQSPIEKDSQNEKPDRDAGHPVGARGSTRRRSSSGDGESRQPA